MKQLSLRWELMLLCIVLVTMPTILMGVVGFVAYQNFAEAELENRLQERALAIRTQAYDYIEQNQRVLRREEVLVKKRIESLAQTARQILNSVTSQHTDLTSFEIRQMLLDQLRHIRVNRSGHLFVLNAQSEPLINSALLNTAATPTLRDNFYRRIDSALDQIKQGDVVVISYPWGQGDRGRFINRYTALAYAENLDMVIGVTISETDFRSVQLEKQLQDQLRYRLSQEQVGETGYVWVLNSDSRYVVSRHNLRNGEDMSDIKDEHGHPLVEHMVKQAIELPAGQAGLIYYHWRALGKRDPEPKAAAVAYVSEWDWVVGVSINLNEFYSGLQTMREVIAKICAGFILVGSFVAYLCAGFVIRPLLHLKGVATAAAQGNLDLEVDGSLVRQPTEIGSLARSFALMIVNLRRAMHQKQQDGELLAAQNRALQASEERLIHAFEELEVEKQKFHDMAITDPLTALYNRRGFAIAAEHMWKTARRKGSPLTVAMLDIDYFKRINDQYSHAIGDIVLQDLARLLGEALRDADLVARIGGEEFALLLDQSLPEAMQALERFRQAVEAQPVHVTGEVICYTVSIGAVAVDVDQHTLDTALNAADEQLYRAKAEGRNRCCKAD